MLVHIRRISNCHTCYTVLSHSGNCSNLAPDTTARPQVAEGAAPSNTSYMLHAALPSLQRNCYRECHSDTTVEHIYQEIFAAQESLEGDFPISSFTEVKRIFY